MLEEIGQTANVSHANMAAPADAATSETVKAALWYASLGLKVFPCKSDKSPFVRWKDEMSSDAEQIKFWWQAHPSAMIGLPCGSANGIAVLDIDIKDAVNGFESLNTKGLEIPNGTFTVTTPTGGMHFYFKLRNGEIIRNSAGKIGEGVDVRGEGGYVIAPPSINASGAYVLSDASNWDQFKELVQ